MGGFTHSGIQHLFDKKMTQLSPNSDLSFSSYRLRLLLEEKLAAQLTDEVCRKKLRF